MADAAPHDPNTEIPLGLDGLSAMEAHRLLAEVGPNRWVKQNRWARVREVIGLLLDPMAVMLLVAATVYYLLGETRDAIVLALALVPVLGVDVVLEARSRAALDKLARAAAPFADVVRDARVQSVPIEEVVPGDLLVLGEGRVIAADGVIQWVANLSVDESSLTGESDPQTKRAWTSETGETPSDARFFAGSLVLTGHGFGRVGATGAKTQYGGIAALVAETTPTPSPLQQRSAVLVQRLGVVALIVAAGLFILSVARGEPWTRALLGAVSLAMAAIPEEFPVVLTLFLSVGAWRLAARGMLVRRLASVETLGSTTVICTDKTGTLTRGEFQLTRHVLLTQSISEHDLLETAVLACEQHPTDAMERAIRMYAETHGVSLRDLSARLVLVRDYDFDTAGKHMSHVWHSLDAENVFIVAAKGAIEGVLAHCQLDPEARRAVLDENERLAADGLRVLAVAARRTDRLGTNREEDERDLTLYGLLGFQDPLRPEVPAAIHECQRAGIRVTMITGDHALTAHAVAEAAGILHDDDLIVTGDELASMGEAERAVRIARAAIFARISPAQKFMIVDGLKATGAVVAMTGDGVNDAPALRRADIGIAMGKRGTDVARATADLVLLDDNFASIVATVREGRHIFQNIQRAFLYLIAFHIPIVALAVLSPLSGVPLLLLPIHLVWLELIVHPVSALVFQSEPVTSAVMTRPPRNPAAPMLPRPAVVRSALSGAALAAASFGMYWWQWHAVGEAQARALALVVLLAGYQTLIFAERRALPELSMDLVPRTRLFWTVWCASALSLVAILYVPPVSHLFGVVPPAGAQALTAIVLGVVAVGWRLLPRRRAKNAGPGRWAAILGLVSVGLVAGADSASVQQPRLPITLDAYLASVAHLDTAERKLLLSGAPLTKLLDGEPGKEIAVLGVIWIRAMPGAYVEQMKDIEHFERGRAFRITRRISNPPRLEDFAQLDLPDEDLEDLQHCRIGDCELKLGADAIQTLRAEIDWKKPTAKADAVAAFRRLSFEYVNGYLEGGNAALAVYRDKDRPTFVADEFRSMIDRVPALTAHLPDVKRYLLEFPRATLPDVTGFLYWQETQIGLKPTIRINHLIIQPRADGTVVASKMLYANHYAWTALELRFLLPESARGPGFWFVTVNRSRSDGLSGFTGRVVRQRVRNEVRQGTLASLTATKNRLERAVR